MTNPFSAVGSKLPIPREQAEGDADVHPPAYHGTGAGALSRSTANRVRRSHRAAICRRVGYLRSRQRRRSARGAVAGRLAYAPPSPAHPADTGTATPTAVPALANSRRAAL